MLTSWIRVDSENVELEALRELQYEGTAAEVAQGFKEQGNEMVRSKRWKDGQEFYTKAIAVLSQKTQPQPGIARKDEVQSNGDEERQMELALTETCHTNRALCNLHLSESSHPL